MDKMSHLEILDMIARGMFGCPQRLPIDLDNWPQVRPAMRAAHDELVSLRSQLAAANADWADDYTHLQQLCISSGIDKATVEGDSYYVPGIQDLADMLGAEIERLRAERDKLDSYLEHTSLRIRQVRAHY